MPLHVSSTVVLIIRRSKLYYTASGIVTLCRWPSGTQVERGLQSCLYMFLALFCSSSGGQNCIIQHLISSHCVGGRPVHRLREDSSHASTCFEHCCAPHQEVKIVLCSIWYRHTCRWPSGAQVERGSLSTCVPDGHLHSVTIPDAV